MTQLSLWKQLYVLGKPFWFSEQRWAAVCTLATVMFLMFVSSALSVYAVKRPAMRLPLYNGTARLLRFGTRKQDATLREYLDDITKSPEHHLG